MIMKRIYLYLFIFTGILFTACDKEDTTIYGGNTHLTFSTDISTDSLEISFYFYPGEETLEIPVPLSLQGRYSGQVNRGHRLHGKGDQLRLA